jgi:hypothetical protein
MSALKKQRFHPYVIDGKKRPVQIAVPIQFMIAKEIDIISYEKKEILRKAQIYMEKPIRSIIDIPAPRSSAGPRTYYSESRLLRPATDSNSPALVNTDAFREHAEALAELGEIVPALTLAHMLSGKRIYAERAIEHLRMWLIDPETSMEAHFRYARIMSQSDEASELGIYEALPLAEILRSLPHLSSFLNKEERSALQQWFSEFAVYLETLDPGLSRENRINISGNTSLFLYALTGAYIKDDNILSFSRERYENTILPFYLGPSSPLFDTVARSYFNQDIFIHADILMLLAIVLEESGYSYWALESSASYDLSEITSRIYHDLLNDSLKPAAHYRGRFLSLLVAGKIYERSEYLELWKNIEHLYPDNGNFPLRQPLLWLK